MKSADIAWAAGLFEGEGWLTGGIYADKKFHLKAGLASTDKDVVERFHRIVGVGSVREKVPNGLGRKPQWTWQTQNLQSFQYIVALFWAWLGERRRTRASGILLANKERAAA